MARCSPSNCGYGLPSTLGAVGAEPGPCAVVDADEEGIAISFAGKPEQSGRTGLADGGVYLADYRIFDFFPEKKPLESGPLDLELHVILNMAVKMKIYFIQDFALDIGISQAYEVAHDLLGQGGLR